MITGDHRDTWVEVNLNAITHNIQEIKKYCQLNDINLMAVVKAGGYGHGAVEVAKTAIEAGASYLVVSMLDEAIELREAGITVPILVLGWTKPEYISVAVEHNLTLTVLQLDWLLEAKKYIKDDEKIRVHIKIDTGMGRFGIRSKEEVTELFKYIQTDSNFLLDGVFTHYSTADEHDLTYMNFQHERFLEVLKWIEELGLEIPIIHNGNSAFGLRFPKKVFQYFRLGISMYGLTPAPSITDQLPISLKPAFALKSRLVQVKELPAGEAVGYGAKYRTEKNEWIGTLQIGYADGWLRAHSAVGGEVLINGQRGQFVGPICMDQCMVRLPGPAELGTVVTLIGIDGEDEITAEEVAERLGTINYEIPCVIGQRIPRIYIDEK